jgi:alpha-N-arabinofuranosidase
MIFFRATWREYEYSCAANRHFRAGRFCRTLHSFGPESIMNKIAALALTSIAAAALAAAATPVITVDASHPAGTVSPRFYGLMTEEINHCYDGGLYAELIRNRNFMDSATAPSHWSLVSGDGSAAAMALDPANPLNENLTNSLRVTVTQADPKHPAGVANAGYWGIPVEAHTKYHATLWAKAEAGFSGPATVAIVSQDGSEVYASETISGLSPRWNRFEVTLKTGRVAPTTQARCQITFHQPGTVWIGFVSLFPPTWHDQTNGFRRDLMQMLVDMHPKFLRFPGGNFLEGQTPEQRFEWKKTLGPIEERPGHSGPWGYRSTDGLGLLEFLEWCEDMHAEPVLAVYAGYSLGGTHIDAGPGLEPYVTEALEEIEYVTGDTNTTWGARRARDGHPAPFSLTYVEIGNEDWFDKSGSYDARFAQFHDAIKARYPHLKTISTIGNDQPEKMRVHSRTPDMMDEHYYRSTDEFLQSSPDYARKYDRSGPEIFVGEWAAHEDGKIRPWDAGARQQPPTPSMKAAIGDAAFMAAMERNADLIKMNCYAPLFVNVNPGARQWRPDLIGYDALTAYGSPSYYAIQMFASNLGDQILSLDGSGKSVQASATRDSKTGEIFLKLVNPEPEPQRVELQINGATLASKAKVITLAGCPEDTNSIERPRNVVPETSTFPHVGPRFQYPMPAYSIVVIKLDR